MSKRGKIWISLTVAVVLAFTYLQLFLARGFGLIWHGLNPFTMDVVIWSLGAVAVALIVTFVIYQLTR